MKESVTKGQHVDETNKLKGNEQKMNRKADTDLDRSVPKKILQF